MSTQNDGARLRDLLAERRKEQLAGSSNQIEADVQRAIAQLEESVTERCVGSILIELQVPVGWLPTAYHDEVGNRLRKRGFDVKSSLGSQVLFVSVPK